VGTTLSRTDTGAPASTVLLSPRRLDGSVIDQAQLQAAAGVANAAPVFPQSADPAIHSCDYRLADRPQAAPFVAAAEAALTAQGLATRQQIEGPGALYLLSDDPLDANQVIGTIDVPGRAVAAPINGVQPPGTSVRAYDEVALEAFVDRSTHQVTETVSGLSN
jgi:hypothetical protein